MKNYLTIFIFACLFGTFTSCGEEEIATDPEPEEKTLEGNYFGSWSSSTASASFPGTPVSAKLSYVNTDKTVLGGEFFISSNFTSCCNSGANDGTLLLTLDGTIVTDFKYSDIIPDCGGNFVGTGTIEDDNVFKIDFTGTDCDGDHVGTLLLSQEQ